jgi:sigma-70-like protein
MDYAAMSAENMAHEHAAEGPLPQELLARGSERGYVTYDELSATLPLDQLSSEEIEDTMTMLSELGITVTESDESEEPRYRAIRRGRTAGERRARKATSIVEPGQHGFRCLGRD